MDIRKIIFRGKRIDNGEWVHGYFVKKSNYTLLFCHDRFLTYYTVVPETVCRFTEMCDKNKKDIYESDIVKDKYGTVGYVVMYHGEWRINYGGDDIFSLYDDIEDELVVIGNIHDNPELLNTETE